MKRMRFFAVIFTILISIVASNFVASENATAQTTDPIIGTDQCLREAGTSEARALACVAVNDQDLARWKAASKVSLGNLGIVGTVNYQQTFDAYADIIFKSYRADPATSKTQAFGYILNGIPLEKLTDPQKNMGYGRGMFNLTQARLADKNATVQEKSTVAQIETVLTQMLGNESALQTLREQGGSANEEARNNYNTYTSSLTNATNQTISNEQAKKKADANKKECTLIPTFTFGDCVDVIFSWIITHTLLAVAGWLLWITATVMNYAINVGILQFASWAPEALYPVWLVVRQITSLFVVFAGLWLGFMYIIDKGDQFKKYIPTVLIFALFVNFSYPLTRTVIDISNIISLNIYASTVGASTLEASTISVGADKTAGTLIMNKLGLVGVVDYALGDGKTTEGSLNSINSVGPALLAVLFILYAAWIFFIISALLVTRTAVLVFLIIASPLLFVDKVIPKLGEHATKLRGIFVEMLFVGPVFTIMLALTLKFLEVFQSGPLKNGGSISSIAAGGDGAITMFFNMLMMLIMLHIMFKVTKATSGKIGEAVAGVASTVGGLAVGAGFGGMAMAGRKFVGGAARVAQRQGMKEGGWMTKDNAMSRMAFRATSAVGNANYDGRNSAAIKWGASKMGIGGMGTGGKLGYEALIEKKEGDRAQLDRNRRNFSQRAINSKDKRIREDYESIQDPTRKAEFLKNIENDTVRKSLENKEIAEYKAFADDIQGRKDKEAFMLKHKGNENLLERVEEYNTKVSTDKADKMADKAMQRDALDVQRRIADGIAAQTKILEGVNQNKGNTGEASSSVNTQSNYLTPAPSVSPEGYPANPKSALTSEKTGQQANAKASVSQKEHVLDTVPF